MQEIINKIKEIKTNYGVKVEDSKLLVSVVTAEIMGLQLSIPSSEVDDLRGYFRSQHEVLLNQKLAKINEYTVIDIDNVIKLTYDIWCARYMLVHKPNSVRTGRLLSFMISENNRIVPSDYLEVINKYPQAYMGRHQLKQLEQNEEA